LDDILSLRRVRAFTLNDSTSIDEMDPISYDRIIGTMRISVASLTLGLCTADQAERRWITLLPLFDPEHVHIRPSSFVALPFDFTFAIDLYCAPWYRLRSIEFMASASARLLGSSSFLRRSLDRSDAGFVPLRVVYDISTGQSDDLGRRVLLKEAMTDLVSKDMDMFASYSRLEEVVIRVESKEQASMFEALLADGSDLINLPSDWDSRLEKIRFEISPPPATTQS
jgi:hypothetical protein